MEQVSMEMDMVLVVSEREFPVNRKALTENSLYFRAMLEGGFREAHSNRIALKGMGDPDAFGVLLKYTLNKMINLNSVSRHLSSVLALSDMLNDDTFPEFLKQELFGNWTDLESAESVLTLAEALNVRASLLLHIFEILKTFFIERGKGSSKRSSCSGISNPNFPNMIVDFFGIEEARNFNFSDFNDTKMDFVKGVVSWILEEKINESGIRNVVRCLGIQYLLEKSLFEIIAKQEKSKHKDMLQKEVEYCIETSRNVIRNSICRLCIGRAVNMSKMFSFNFQNWVWDAVELDKVLCVRTSSPISPQLVNEFDELKVSVLFWYSSFEGLICDNKVDDKSECFSNEPLYCSGQHAGDEAYHLLIFELEYGKKRFTTVFSTPVPRRILGCHLLRLDDVLHGFVSSYDGDRTSTTSYFALRRNKEDKTWFDSDFSLKPVLCNIHSILTPVATAISETGILVLFRRYQEHLWLANYNLKTGLMEPLGHLPMPGKLLENSMGYVPNLDELEKEVEQTSELDVRARKLFSFNLACCCNSWSPLFHLSTVAGKTRYYVASPFFHGFSRCAINGHHHTPQLKTTINVCSYPH